MFLQIILFTMACCCCFFACLLWQWENRLRQSATDHLWSRVPFKPLLSGSGQRFQSREHPNHSKNASPSQKLTVLDILAWIWANQYSLHMCNLQTWLSVFDDYNAFSCLNPWQHSFLCNRYLHYFLFLFQLYLLIICLIIYLTRSYYWASMSVSQMGKCSSVVSC